MKYTIAYEANPNPDDIQFLNDGIRINLKINEYTSILNADEKTYNIFLLK
jgi:hypothetical protein